MFKISQDAVTEPTFLSPTCSLVSVEYFSAAHNTLAKATATKIVLRVSNNSCNVAMYFFASLRVWILDSLSPGSLSEK